MLQTLKLNKEKQKKTLIGKIDSRLKFLIIMTKLTTSFLEKLIYVKYGKLITSIFHTSLLNKKSEN
jgi:hypothetical protein